MQYFLSLITTLFLLGSCQDEATPTFSLQIDKATLAFKISDIKTELEKNRDNYVNDNDYLAIVSILDSSKNSITITLDSTHIGNSRNEVLNSWKEELKWCSFELLQRNHGNVFVSSHEQSYTSKEFSDEGGVWTEFITSDGFVFWKVQTIWF